MTVRATLGDCCCNQTASFGEARINFGVQMTAFLRRYLLISRPSSLFTSPVGGQCSSTEGPVALLSALCWCLRVMNDYPDWIVLGSLVGRVGWRTLLGDGIAAWQGLPIFALRSSSSSLNWSSLSHYTVKSQSLHSGDTVIIQWSHSHYTVEPQSLYSEVTVIIQWSHSRYTVKTQSLYSEVTVITQWSHSR